MLSNKAKILLAILALFVGATTRSWAVEISYTVKTPGAVSLGIYDGKGRLVRTLQSGKKIKEPGTNKIEWDGKDDLGKPLPPGPYTYKGLSAKIGWESQLMMGRHNLCAIFFADALRGWVSGTASSPGKAPVYTTDGGQTWTNVSPNSSTLRAIFFVDAAHGWAVGGAGGSGNEPPAMIMRYAGAL